MARQDEGKRASGGRRAGARKAARSSGASKGVSGGVKGGGRKRATKRAASRKGAARSSQRAGSARKSEAKRPPARKTARKQAAARKAGTSRAASRKATGRKRPAQAKASGAKRAAARGAGGGRSRLWIESPDQRAQRPGQTLATRNHEVIRAWAEERGGVPATVPGTERDGRPGVLRFDFPDYGGGRLRQVDWDEWFETFDQRNLVFLFQEQLKDGRQSNFFRLDNPEREDA